ncbi:glycoside hydrolase family 31 protein [Lachnoclostridium phytofermentans]|uniref:Glycoside hydrolase family 31 n=1 Tax=Lachnoclostridium phytofermentans (strain ATCC 700394 / DSM 18823 / ISDg) TaxID=357809 RepID=A9KT35_LACP7|nr:TIM-barrel domain-containing protein [Lachnoclostridium phytofermentans]ABX42246.1 glycoside hydrolase family 31 [Lachnoclostridium phytofermentans ISDg]
MNQNTYDFKTSPVANQKAVIQGDCYRFTVLTSRLIRLEYNEDGYFEDLATQVVINREFPVPEYRVKEGEDSLEVITEHLHLTYNKKLFSKNGLCIQVKGNLSAYRSIWHFGETGENLKGTARTLDETDGEIALEDGLLSRNGFAIIDDSRSILLNKDGWVKPREQKGIDLYFFGYGREYLKCLNDYYVLCGKTPMLPRYTLGNWWSRFYPYSEDEYKQLVRKFETENVPFSMAVIDMDWHLTKLDPKYGSGWTGYTWNREYFKEPKEFLDWLHDHGMHVTLNVHPADGVHGHEEMYLPMAKELGVDYTKEDKIQFDISDRKFLEAYFKYLHHPHEEIGVDFWWVDWQQGGSSKIEGLDPLWMLNHFHFLDSGRDGKRPLTFSRYAGLGSHRYPLGFSGDTFATWDTLDFQPYFTATASNAGFGWWSHDIGGHMHGVKSDEMLVRWIQFGVFSPIMRIHSSDNPFFVKEPWKYNSYIGGILTGFLQLRHQLIPYLYTMNYLFHSENKPLIQPMYYQNPENEEAYHVPNQYYFGSELIACPITKPLNLELNMGGFDGWLPEGIYFDFFTGRVYRGGRRIRFYRELSTIPVFARAGAIIPMVVKDAVSNSAENPSDLLIKVFAGADGRFDLYEDNSLTSVQSEVREVITSMQFTWNKDSEFKIQCRSKNNGIIPEERNYQIDIVGCKDSDLVSVFLEGKEISFTKRYDAERNIMHIQVFSITVNKALVIKLPECDQIIENDIIVQVFNLLDKTQIDFDCKSLIYRIIKKHRSRELAMAEIQALHLPDELLGALYEVIMAY